MNCALAQVLSGEFSFLVIGAPGERGAGLELLGDPENNDHVAAGAAYIFSQERDEWEQRAYLKSPNTQSSSAFGTSLVLDDQRLVIGASGEETDSEGGSLQSGAAYVRNLLPD